MSSITITTQEEFDALPNSFQELTFIVIESDPTITIVVNRKWSNAMVWVRKNSSVEARDNSMVEAYGNSTVEARDNSTVEAWDNSSVKYAGSLTCFSSWFLLNKDNRGIVEAMKKQFADQPEYMQKINMILLFS